MSTTTSAAGATPAQAAQTASALATKPTPSLPPLDGEALAKLVEGSSDAKDKHLVIRKLTDEIVIFSQPFTRSGLLSLGGRSTAVRLPSGVFVYASHPYTAATQNAMDLIGGKVKWLVTPDGEHSMFIDEWVKAFPDAKPIGVKRHQEKKPHINWAGLFGAGGEDQTYGFEPDISLHQVSAHVNHELVAIHHPSGTLLEADMLFNLPPKEQYSRAGGLPFFTKLAGGMSSFSPGGTAQGLMAKSVASDKELLKKELQPIMAAKFDRIVPCHGDVIENGGKVEWDKVWGKYA
ncbi:hypothetical protein EHS25_008795 [Saitozyma podzolica]|uniref:Metallo-beta-lactamase domain-containing protein n=1 Tax=Saitozyma podzolica TaxID=1890683 RepID=A0A427YMU9_9TREE|nr:hypothetical protein EHS25_008795 [Saitozyma podzolica]